MNNNQALKNENAKSLKGINVNSLQQPILKQLDANDMLIGFDCACSGANTTCKYLMNLNDKP
jgi:hypothetical protein